MKVDLGAAPQKRAGEAGEGEQGEEGYVLSLFDCAGQPIFLEGLHPLFFTPDTVYLVVFNMAELHDEGTRRGCLDTLDKWISMVWLNAPGAPVLLVGTHKDQVAARLTAGDERKALERLSALISQRFDRHRMWPFMKRYDAGAGAGAGGGGDMRASLAFFPVDNTQSDGAGSCDPAVAALRGAVQGVLEDPESIFARRVVPNAWMELLELVQIEAEDRGLKRVTRQQVLEWAPSCGLGRGAAAHGFSLGEEVDGFLRLMHAYGLVVWYGGAAPQLREVVVLDPQWLVDAISVVIRDFTLHGLSLDRAAQIAFPGEWNEYRESGYLTPALLSKLWAGWSGFDPRELGFLSSLMQHFSLTVPMPPDEGGAGSSEGGGGGGGGGGSTVARYLVPTMLPEPPAGPPSLRPDLSPGARTCYLCFGDSPNSRSAAAATAPRAFARHRLGFLPPALLPRLQAKIVAWSQSVGGGAAVPETHRGTIEARFGALHFRLERLRPEVPCLRLTVLQGEGGDHNMAHVVLQRVEAMIDEVKRECLPNLQCFAALPVLELDAELGEAAVNAGERCLVPAARVREAQRAGQDIAMAHGRLLQRRRFAPWMAPPAAEADWYHLMVSYRQRTEKQFAALLFDALQQCVVDTGAGAGAGAGGAGEGRSMRVYLDQARLQDGGQWDVAVVRGMCRSFVFVPIVSAGSVGGMADRYAEAPGAVDYVLLEWMLALELYERQVVKRVFPLFVGAEKALEPSRDGPASASASARMGDFFKEGHLDRVPDEVPAATLKELQRLAVLVKLPMPTKRRTMREVATKIASFQGVQLWDLAATHGRADQPMLAWGLHQNCARRITAVVSDSDVVKELRAIGPQTAEIDGLVARAAAAGEAGDDARELELARELEPKRAALRAALDSRFAAQDDKAVAMLAPRLPEGKQYHLFLSHTKRHQYTVNMVREVNVAFDAKGFKCFYDVQSMTGDTRITLDTLERSVAASVVLVLFLDDKMFDSAWVRKEVAFAAKHGVERCCIFSTDHNNLESWRTSAAEHGVPAGQERPPHVHPAWTGVGEDGATGFNVIDMWCKGRRLTDAAWEESTKHVLGGGSRQAIRYGVDLAPRREALRQIEEVVRAQCGCGSHADGGGSSAAASAAPGNPYAAKNYVATLSRDEFEAARKDSLRISTTTRGSLESRQAAAARELTGAAAGEPAALIEDAQVQAFLRQAKLLEFERALHEYGVKEMEDLADVEEAELAEMGLKKGDVKRFRRVLQKSQA
eukprot:g6541.t1